MLTSAYGEDISVSLAVNRAIRGYGECLAYEKLMMQCLLIDSPLVVKWPCVMAAVIGHYIKQTRTSVPHKSLRLSKQATLTLLPLLLYEYVCVYLQVPI